MYWLRGQNQRPPEQYIVFENPSCSAVRSDHGKGDFTWLWYPWARVMEASSASWSTHTQWCYSCISSWYGTFFNITLLQFLCGGGPQVTFHRVDLLGSAALWLLAFPFTTGKSYSHHLLAVIALHHIRLSPPGPLQSCKHIAVSGASQWGRWPLKDRQQPSSSSSTAAPLGTASSHPQLLSHQRHQGCPVIQCRQEGGKKAKSQRPHWICSPWISFVLAS